MEELFIKALNGQAHEYAVIPTHTITFSPELLKACESNVCGKYNNSWTCPPAVGPMEKQREKIMAFSSVFVFTTKSNLDDSFDYEGMMRAKDCHDKLTAGMHACFGKTNPVYGAGGCNLCRELAGETCAYPDPCRFPDKTYSSIEAAGIDVTQLSRAGGLRYNNGENTITYFSMVLFNG
jgi:predicted metal-binding protein